MIKYSFKDAQASNPTSDTAKNIVPNKNMMITRKLNKHQHECNIYLTLKAFLITNNNMARTHKTLAPKNPPYIPFKTTVSNSKIFITSVNILSFVFIVSFKLTVISLRLVTPPLIASSIVSYFSVKPIPASERA